MVEWQKSKSKEKILKTERTDAIKKKRLIADFLTIITDPECGGEIYLNCWGKININVEL